MQLNTLEPYLFDQTVPETGRGVVRHGLWPAGYRQGYRSLLLIRRTDTFRFRIKKETEKPDVVAPAVVECRELLGRACV